jgi:hypothetical protein
VISNKPLPVYPPIKHIAANNILYFGCGAMDSPYLESGESIILTTDRVSIDSQQYDLLLTTKYLILIDIRYARFLPQKISLQTVLSVKAGKIATGDPVITLYFSDTSRTGGSDQMNLIFSRQPGEQRDRERDEWLKKLMEFVVAGRQEAIGPRTVPSSQEIGIRPATRRQIAPEMQLPHSTIIDSHPEPIELAIIHDEVEEPVSPEVPASGAGEAGPSEEESPEAPVLPDTEKSDVPEIITPGGSPEEIIGPGIPEIAGAHEIPQDSGEQPPSGEMASPVTPESDASREDLTGSVIPGTPASEETPAESPEEAVSPDRVPEEPEIISPEITREEAEGLVTPDIPPSEELPAEVSSVTPSPEGEPEEPKIIEPEPSREEPEVLVTPDIPPSEELPAEVSSVTPSPDREPEEPGIIAPEPSREEVGILVTPDIPPSEELPAEVSSVTPSPEGELEEPEIIAPELSPEDAEGLVITPETVTPEERTADSALPPSSPEPISGVTLTKGEEAEGRPGASIPEAFQPGEPAIPPEEERTSPSPGSPPPPKGVGRPQKSSIIAAAIIVLILGIAAIALYSPSSFGAPARDLFPVPTPSLTITTPAVPTSLGTPAPTPVVIPPTGVWVRVTYPHDFYGRLGNPGSLREVAGSGDRLYQMSSDERLVQVQMYKTDNSGDILSVDIYRNGKLMTHRTTSSPKGLIDLLIDATTGAPPGIPPRVTQTTGPVPAENQTRPVITPTSAPVVTQTSSVPSPTTIPAVNTTTQITNQTNNQTGNRVMYF